MTEETLAIGADVIAADGDKVGSLDYVVVHPPDLRITDIVVGTGLILGRDIVIPADTLARVEGGKVYLRLNKGDLEKYPDYINIHYQAPPQGWIPPAGFMYPPTGVLWPEGMSYYPAPASVTVNAPPGTTGISAGMDVRSSDGHTIGTISKVEIGDAGQDVVGLVVKEGLIFHHDVTIPTSAVSGIQDGAVLLNLTADEVKGQFGS